MIDHRLLRFLKQALALISSERRTPLNPIKMCELGNQIILAKQPIVAKEYFVSLGMIHVSIDMNGLDGSLQLDLSNPISELIGEFDVITNFGTSEHILNQYQVFKNIHNFTKIGGFQVHAVPLVGHWERHCPYHYGKNFFDQLAKLSNYEIQDTQILSFRKNQNKELLLSILKKTSDLFVSEKDFYTCEITENQKPLRHATTAWRPNEETA